MRDSGQVRLCKCWGSQDSECFLEARFRKKKQEEEKKRACYDPGQNSDYVVGLQWPTIGHCLSVSLDLS